MAASSSHRRCSPSSEELSLMRLEGHLSTSNHPEPATGSPFCSPKGPPKLGRTHLLRRATWHPARRVALPDSVGQWNWARSMSRSTSATRLGVSEDPGWSDAASGYPGAPSSQRRATWRGTPATADDICRHSCIVHAGLVTGATWPQACPSVPVTGSLRVESTEALRAGAQGFWASA